LAPAMKLPNRKVDYVLSKIRKEYPCDPDESTPFFVPPLRSR